MKLNINDEQGIEFLHWIFERELKPPFREDMEDNEYYPYYPYYNRDNELIGWLYSISTFIIAFKVKGGIEYKVCAAFDLPSNERNWITAIGPYLKSWMEDQINIKLDDIG